MDGKFTLPLDFLFEFLPYENLWISFFNLSFFNHYLYMVKNSPGTINPDKMSKILNLKF